ncbi:MAG: hypothetical protein JRJ84_17595 [Deltaproteobacteria bacterium]|nr:hypothetical protein [Deltaproteobacteria bacterium]
MSISRVFPLVLLSACVGMQGLERPDDPVEFDYVNGYDPDNAETIWGGGHFIADFSNNREAISYSNQATKIHPELKGEAAKFDATRTQGSSDWDVFASSWWPQSKNGIAWRWNSSVDDYNDVSDHDGLSPVEKYDFLFNPDQKTTVGKVEHWNYDQLREDEADRGPKHDHPEVEVMGPATKWEMTHHGNYQGEFHPDSWWGHCNGWASYVTTEPMGAPLRDIRVKIASDGDIVECAADDASCTLVRMGDIEALMAEIYFNDQATFGGQRCEERPDEMERDEYGRPKDAKCRDLNPGAFHVTTVGLLNRGAKHLFTGKEMKPAFVIDHNYDYQVWNFPLVRYEMTNSEEVDEAAAAALVGETSDYQWNENAKKFVKVQLTYSMVSDSVGASQMLKQAGQRNVPLKPVRLNYVLELDENDVILGGEWIADPGTGWGGTNSKELHPDFIWMATDPQGYSESSDDTGGWSDNPFISYPNVQKLLACSNDPNTCASSETPTPDPDPEPDDDAFTCNGHCGGSVTVNATTCWCDDLCESYGDCCDDIDQYCNDDPAPTGDAPTCEDHCGESTAVSGSDPACYCDSACESYGDCCDDKVAVCGS